jgi:phage shock protein A
MSDKHDKALDLTEKALDALDEGNEGTADELLEKAKKLDPSAIQEVVEDLGNAAGKA